MNPETPPDIGTGIERRIMIAQALYAFGAGLCAINTYCDITFIMLVQLNYVIARGSARCSGCNTAPDG